MREEILHEREHISHEREDILHEREHISSVAKQIFKVYTHVSKNAVDKIISPLDRLADDIHQKKRKPEKPKTIEIKYVISNDSIAESTVLKVGELDSLILELKSISNDIQSKQIEAVEKAEDKGIFDKFYSIIVAVVLVFAGFFGFKNITEIKGRAIEIAEESSKKIAEETAIDASQKQFEKVFTAQYKGEVMDLATASFSNVIDQEFSRLYQQIELLETRIEELEAENPGEVGNNQINEEQAGEDMQDNNGPLNPFDNE